MSSNLAHSVPCHLHVAESTTGAAATATGWATLFLSGPSIDCQAGRGAPGWTTLRRLRNWT